MYFSKTRRKFARRASLRDALAAALEAGTPISSVRLLAVAAYFPLHSLSGAARLLDRPWPEPVAAVLVQQMREPQEEAQLRAAMPRLTPIEDTISRLVQNQYEENPYPRWVRIPPVEKAEHHRQIFAPEIPACRFPASGAAGKSRSFSAPAAAPASLRSKSRKA